MYVALNKTGTNYTEKGHLNTIYYHIIAMAMLHQQTANTWEFLYRNEIIFLLPALPITFATIAPFL